MSRRSSWFNSVRSRRWHACVDVNDGGIRCAEASSGAVVALLQERVEELGVSSNDVTGLRLDSFAVGSGRRTNSAPRPDDGVRLVMGLRVEDAPQQLSVLRDICCEWGPRY